LTDLDSGFPQFRRDASAGGEGWNDGWTPPQASSTPVRKRGRSARHRRPITEVAAAHLHQFYSRRMWQVTLLLTTVLLCYAGGGAMFYLHAVVMGEQGPAIAPVYHWLLDSTLGFIALTPALFFLIPATHHSLKHHAPRHHPLAVGTAFAFITAPGPIIHDEAVGRGTPLAQLATNFFGRDTALVNPSVHVVTHTVFSECGLQVLVGLPVYITLAYLAFGAQRRFRSLGSIGLHEANSIRRGHPAHLRREEIRGHKMTTSTKGTQHRPTRPASIPRSGITEGSA
jgi:hypothetical protein